MNSRPVETGPVEGLRCGDDEARRTMSGDQ